MFKSVLGITRQINSEVLAILSGPLPEKIMTEAVPMVTFFSHVFRVSRARNETEVSASVCLILQATALFVRQATEPACVQSLCHLKNQVDTHYLARVM